MNPKILVTGANGYTGGQFCRYLNDKGIPVRGMYWEPDGVPDCSLEHVEFVPGDLRDRNSLKRALDGIEIVHNIAALYRPTNVSNKMYWDANVEGVRNIIELAADVGVKRFVQCSTIGVHGHIVEPPATEIAPIKPDDYYQYTKWKGEELALELSEKLGLSLVVIRPAAIYGSLESRFLKMTKFIQSGRFIMFGKGDTPYHFIHIRDLCDAFMLCAEKTWITGETYIIADNQAVTLNHIVEVISLELGVKTPYLKLPFPILYVASFLCEFVCKPFKISPPLHRRRAQWFRAVRSFDISKARRDLGFDPKVNPEQGLKEMIQSYREAGWVS